MALIKAIRLRSLRDLVHVLSVSQVPLVHHISLDSVHVYFVPMVIAGDSSVIYFYVSEAPLNGAFLAFNNFTGEVLVSERWLSDTRYTVIPIVEVDSQNLFPEKLLLKELSRTNRGVRAAKSEEPEGGGAQKAAAVRAPEPRA